MKESTIDTIGRKVMLTIAEVALVGVAFWICYCIPQWLFGVEPIRTLTSFDDILFCICGYILYVLVGLCCVALTGTFLYGMYRLIKWNYKKVRDGW